MVMNKTNLFYYAKPWEAFACVCFCSAIVIAILLDVPSSEDEGVVVITEEVQTVDGQLVVKRHELRIETGL